MQPSEDVEIAGARFRIDPQAGGFPARARDGRPASFWQLVRDGRWEADVFAFLARRLPPNGVFLDVGAWIGPFSLMAASMGARVVAVEPDPVAAARLLANRAANPGFDIELVAAALHPAGGPLRLFSEAFGDSETSVHVDRRRSGRTVTAAASLVAGSLKAADLLALAGGRIDVLKVDIEGGEFPAADALAELGAETASGLVLSLHPQNVVGAAGAFDPAAGRAEVLRLLETVGLAGARRWGALEWTAERTRFAGGPADLLAFARARGEALDTVFAAPAA